MPKKLTQEQRNVKMLAKMKKISEEFFAKLAKEQLKEKSSRPASIWDTI